MSKGARLDRRSFAFGAPGSGLATAAARSGGASAQACLARIILENPQFSPDMLSQTPAIRDALARSARREAARAAEVTAPPASTATASPALWAAMGVLAGAEAVWAVQRLFSH